MRSVYGSDDDYRCFCFHWPDGKSTVAHRNESVGARDFVYSHITPCDTAECAQSFSIEQIGSDILGVGNGRGLESYRAKGPVCVVHRLAHMIAHAEMNIKEVFPGREPHGKSSYLGYGAVGEEFRARFDHLPFKWGVLIVLSPPLGLGRRKVVVIQKARLVADDLAGSKNNSFAGAARL